MSDLPVEIREILRDVAHGVHGPMVSGMAAAAIVKRDLCPRCAGTGHELLDAPGTLMWGTCHGCNPPASPAPAREGDGAVSDAGSPSALAALVAHLREEADFNRSWTDGRRGAAPSPAYVARRLELATERDRWADAVRALIEEVEPAAEAYRLTRKRRASRREGR